MRKTGTLLLIISSLLFAGKIWFDFSTPLSAYIQSTIKNEDGLGVSIGVKIWKIPQFELTYMRIGNDHYILLKPLMLEGEISSMYSKQFKMQALLNLGIDGSYPDYSSSAYLTTGIEMSYETAGNQGVFFKLCLESGIRLELLQGINKFSPYYIQLIGPIVIKPSMIIGGKF